MGKHIVIAAIVAATMLGGCAGRDPNPVAVVQPGDRDLGCQAIQAEVLANNKTVQGLAAEDALQNRQQYLAVLAAQKHCGGGGEVPAVASLTLSAAKKA